MVDQFDKAFKQLFKRVDQFDKAFKQLFKRYLKD
jgi:hypothetical protein